LLELDFAAPTQVVHLFSELNVGYIFEDNEGLIKDSVLYLTEETLSQLVLVILRDIVELEGVNRMASLDFLLAFRFVNISRVNAEDVLQQLQVIAVVGGRQKVRNFAVVDRSEAEKLLLELATKSHCFFLKHVVELVADKHIGVFGFVLQE